MRSTLHGKNIRVIASERALRIFWKPNPYLLQTVAQKLLLLLCHEISNKQTKKQWHTQSTHKHALKKKKASKAIQTIRIKVKGKWVETCRIPRFILHNQSGTAAVQLSGGKTTTKKPQINPHTLRPPTGLFPLHPSHLPSVPISLSFHLALQGEIRFASESDVDWNNASLSLEILRFTPNFPQPSPRSAHRAKIYQHICHVFPIS